MHCPEPGNQAVSWFGTLSPQLPSLGIVGDARGGASPPGPAKITTSLPQHQGRARRSPGCPPPHPNILASNLLVQNGKEKSPVTDKVTYLDSFLAKATSALEKEIAFTVKRLAGAGQALVTPVTPTEGGAIVRHGDILSESSVVTLPLPEISQAASTSTGKTDTITSYGKRKRGTVVPLPNCLAKKSSKAPHHRHPHVGLASYILRLHLPRTGVTLLITLNSSYNGSVPV